MIVAFIDRRWHLFLRAGQARRLNTEPKLYNGIEIFSLCLCASV